MCSDKNTLESSCVQVTGISPDFVSAGCGKMGRLKRIVTPWKINMELKYGGLEDDVPFQLSDSQVPC